MSTNKIWQEVLAPYRVPLATLVAVGVPDAITHEQEIQILRKARTSPAGKQIGVGLFHRKVGCPALKDLSQLEGVPRWQRRSVKATLPMVPTLESSVMLSRVRQSEVCDQCWDPNTFADEGTHHPSNRFLQRAMAAKAIEATNGVLTDPHRATPAQVEEAVTVLSAATRSQYYRQWPRLLDWLYATINGLTGGQGVPVVAMDAPSRWQLLRQMSLWSMGLPPVLLSSRKSASGRNQLATSSGEVHKELMEALSVPELSGGDLSINEGLAMQFWARFCSMLLWQAEHLFDEVPTTAPSSQADPFVAGADALAYLQEHARLLRVDQLPFPLPEWARTRADVETVWRDALQVRAKTLIEGWQEKVRAFYALGDDPRLHLVVAHTRRPSASAFGFQANFGRAWGAHLVEGLAEVSRAMANVDGLGRLFVVPAAEAAFARAYAASRVGGDLEVVGEIDGDPQAVLDSVLSLYDANDDAASDFTELLAMAALVDA